MYTFNLAKKIHSRIHPFTFQITQAGEVKAIAFGQRYKQFQIAKFRIDVPLHIIRIEHRLIIRSCVFQIFVWYMQRLRLS